MTAPNKWWPIEGHYHLPFLSWLPLPVANFYLKSTNKGQSYQSCSYSKSYFGMKKFLNQYDWSYQFLVPKADAGYLGCGQYDMMGNLLKNLGIKLINRFPQFWSVSKGFIIVIKRG